MIKIGDVLILEPKFSKEKEQYKGMAVEVENNSLFIDYPVNVDTGRVSFLMDGTQLRATCTDSEETVYMFDTEVLGRKKAEIPMVQLLLPEKEQFMKIQRRQFVRVDAEVDAAIHPLNGEFRPFQAVTEDLSAGGAALRVPKDREYPEHMLFFIWLVLPLKSGEIHYLRLKSRIIRTEEKKNGQLILSIQFIENTENDTQALLRYIFERQLSLKKNSMQGW